MTDVVEVQETQVIVTETELVQVITAGTQGPPGTSERFEDLSASISLDDEDSYKVFTNTAATALIIVDLPLGDDEAKFTFMVTNPTYGIRLDAPTDKTIRIAGSESSAGGTMSCAQRGGSVVLRRLTDGNYQAESSMRTWVEA